MPTKPTLFEPCAVALSAAEQRLEDDWRAATKLIVRGQRRTPAWHIARRCAAFANVGTYDWFDTVLIIPDESKTRRLIDFEELLRAIRAKASFITDSLIATKSIAHKEIGMFLQLHGYAQTSHRIWPTPKR